MATHDEMKTLFEGKGTSNIYVVNLRIEIDKIKDSKPDGKTSAVKIVISLTVTKSLNIFFNGNAKAAIELIQVQ